MYDRHRNLSASLQDDKKRKRLNTSVIDFRSKYFFLIFEFRSEPLISLTLDICRAMTPGKPKFVAEKCRILALPAFSFAITRHHPIGIAFQNRLPQTFMSWNNSADTCARGIKCFNGVYDKQFLNKRDQALVWVLLFKHLHSRKMCSINHYDSKILLLKDWVSTSSLLKVEL